jgi:arylsulfatase A-like enzyme
VAIEDGYREHYSTGRDRSERSDYHHFLLEQGYKPNGNGQFSRSFAASLPIEHCKPAFLERKACDFIRRNQAQPFMLCVNFLEPHMPFSGPLNDLHDPSRILFPSSFNDPLEDNEPLRYRLQLELCREKYGKDEASLRRLSARYQGLVAQVDRAVNGILQTLDSLGLADNTLVVFTSDHGDMMGAHGLVMKTVMYEEAVKVPWLMRIPGSDKHQKIIEPRVSHIDLVPTLLELMGIDRPPDLPGRSLVSLLKGESASEDDLFIEWNPAEIHYDSKTHLAGPQEIERLKGMMTRTVIAPDGWKLCLNDVDHCQLFNLQTDPEERTNLFDSGRHQEVIDRLRAKIMAWQSRVGDPVDIRTWGKT